MSVGLFINISGFLLFMVIQALIINGVHECFKGGCIQDINKGKICDGMILYKLWPSFFENNKNKWWSKPLFSCVKCMSSFWGAITYWPTVIYLFGFHLVEIPVFVTDMFILVYLNYFFYQKI